MHLPILSTLLLSSLLSLGTSSSPNPTKQGIGFLEEPNFLLPSGERPEEIVMGFNHSSVLMSNHNVYTWGRNQVGQLGDGTTTNSLVPLNITDQFPNNDPVVQLSLGQDFSAALTESGQLFMWGQNGSGQLGNASNTSSNIPVNITNNFPINDPIAFVNLGWLHAGAITESGRVFMWGMNAFGELGDNTMMNRNVPTEITSLHNINDPVVQLSLGGYFTTARTQQGRLFAWGWNSKGNLGDGTKLDRKVPVDITSSFTLNPNEKVIDLRAGGYHSGAFTSEGRMFTWGFNSGGQLGNGTTTDQSSPVDITANFLPNDPLTSISIGANHSSAVSESGMIYTWGSGFRGRVGHGSETDKITPFNLNAFFPNSVLIRSISMGANHSSALTTKGKVYSWGFNEFGQIGINSLIQQNTPVLITAIEPAPFTTITFQTNGGDPISNLEGEPNSAITAPANPNKTGYTFAGWFEDEDLTLPFNFNTMPDNDLTLYAKWTINSYTITFNTQGGSPIASIVQVYNSNVVAPLAPMKKGYVFTSWLPELPSVMPANDVTVVAQWELDTAQIIYVIGLINELPNINTLTASDRLQVENVRRVYEDLVDEQKAGVTNYQTLLDVEAKLVTLTGEFPWWILLMILPLAYLGYRFRSFFFLFGKKDEEDEEKKKLAKLQKTHRTSKKKKIQK